MQRVAALALPLHPTHAPQERPYVVAATPQLTQGRQQAVGLPPASLDAATVAALLTDLNGGLQPTLHEVRPKATCLLAARHMILVQKQFSRVQSHTSNGNCISFVLVHDWVFAVAAGISGPAVFRHELLLVSSRHQMQSSTI